MSPAIGFPSRGGAGAGLGSRLRSRGDQWCAVKAGWRRIFLKRESQRKLALAGELRESIGIGEREVKG